MHITYIITYVYIHTRITIYTYIYSVCIYMYVYVKVSIYENMYVYILIYIYIHTYIIEGSPYFFGGILKWMHDNGAIRVDDFGVPLLLETSIYL